MKIIRNLMLIVLLLSSCSSNENRNIKSYTVKEYSAKMKFGELSKDQLISSYSIGFYKSGLQQYFVGLVGYSKNDTTFYDEKKDSTTEVKEKNRTFFYNKKGELLYVKVEKGDTIFI